MQSDIASPRPARLALRLTACLLGAGLLVPGAGAPPLCPDLSVPVWHPAVGWLCEHAERLPAVDPSGGAGGVLGALGDAQLKPPCIDGSEPTWWEPPGIWLCPFPQWLVDAGAPVGGAVGGVLGDVGLGDAELRPPCDDGSEPIWSVEGLDWLCELVVDLVDATGP